MEKWHYQAHVLGELWFLGLGQMHKGFRSGGSGEGDKFRGSQSHPMIREQWDVEKRDMLNTELSDMVR